MSLDVREQTPPDTATEAIIRADMDRIDLMTRVLGVTSDAARAELFGVSEKTVQRARAGTPVGSRFMAAVVTALREHERELAKYSLRPTLDTLFEVRVVAVGMSGEEPE